MPRGRSFSEIAPCRDAPGCLLETHRFADLMLIRPIPLSLVALRVLTLAIALVVGPGAGPHMSARGATAVVVVHVDQQVLEEAYKGGQRVERRLSPAHWLDRFLTAPSSCRWSVISDHVDALALDDATSADRSPGGQLPIVKHVPRMERGDPPKA